MNIDSKTRVLVTGGAGFIGSNIVKRLNKMGCKNIWICDRINEQSQKNLIDLDFVDLIHPDDLFNGDFWFEGCDIIFHMGAVSSTTGGFIDCYENNYKFSKALLRHKRNGCYFVYASSAATYGNPKDGNFSDEQDLNNLRPKSNYAISKHLFDKYANVCVFPEILGLKFFNVFGPGEWAKGDMASFIFKSVIGTINGKKPVVKVVDDEVVERDFVPIDMVLRKMFSLIHFDSTGIFNIGSGHALSFGTLLGLAGIEYDIRKGSHHDFGRGYQLYTKSDNKKIYNILGEINVDNMDYDLFKSCMREELQKYVNYIKENKNYFMD